LCKKVPEGKYKNKIYTYVPVSLLITFVISCLAVSYLGFAHVLANRPSQFCISSPFMPTRAREESDDPPFFSSPARSLEDGLGAGAHTLLLLTLILWTLGPLVAVAGYVVFESVTARLAGSLAIVFVWGFLVAVLSSRGRNARRRSRDRGPKGA
jgi:hypothetical protein